MNNVKSTMSNVDFMSTIVKLTMHNVIFTMNNVNLTSTIVNFTLFIVKSTLMLFAVFAAQDDGGVPNIRAALSWRIFRCTSSGYPSARNSSTFFFGETTPGEGQSVPYSTLSATSTTRGK